MKVLFASLLILFCFQQSFSQTPQWKKILSAGENQFTAIGIAPSGKYLLCVTNIGQNWYSSDSAATFNYPDFISNGYYTSFLWLESGIVFAGHHDSDYLNKSTNNGRSWSRSYDDIHIVSLAGDKNCIWGGTFTGKIIYSTNLGKKWNSLNQIFPGAVTTICLDSNYIFIGLKDSGYYKSSDQGAVWDRIGNFTGSGQLCLDNNKGLWLCDQNGLYLSYDKGQTWQKRRDADNPRCLAVDKYNNVYYAGSDSILYRSSVYDSSWTAIANISPFFISIIDSTIYAADYKYLYVNKQDTSSVLSYNNFPLAKGNIYRYSQNYSRQFYPTEAYNLITQRINRDTVINGKKYYMFDKELDIRKMIMYRYDSDSNKVYIWDGKKECLYYDFSLTTGDKLIRTNRYYFYDEEVEIRYGYENLFGKKRKVYYDESRESPSSGGSIDFAGDIGINYSSMSWREPEGGGGRSNSLLEAIIYDKDGRQTYFSYNHKPALTIQPFDALKGDSAEYHFTCMANHPLDKTSIVLAVPEDGIVYIDTVTFSWFYRKDLSETPISTIRGKRMDYKGNYQFDIPIDTALLRHGYDFMYSITVKDRSLIPNYKSWPDSGYYKAVYDPLLKADKETYSPYSYSMEQNYPNPFNPVTFIRYSIEEKGMVRLSIYNPIGQEVRILVNEEKEAGNYSAMFNAQELSSGIYFYRLTSGKFVSTGKMILLK